MTIIAPDGRSVTIIDVCVPFEGSPEALQQAAQEVTKYELLRQTLLQRFERVEVFPFIVGSLGSWFPPNDDLLRSLRVSWKYAALMRRLCVASAISGSQTYGTDLRARHLALTSPAVFSSLTCLRHCRTVSL